MLHAHRGPANRSARCYRGPMSRPRIVLAADGLRPIASGIGRVARLMARVLDEEVHAGAIEARSIVLRDEAGASEFALGVTSARGSRARFVVATHRAARTATHFAYDFSGLARAHCRIPGMRRPYLTWIHGIEAWEQGREDRIERARHADLLLANSHYTRERASACHRGLAHARVCWLGTETDAPAPTRAQDAPPVVLVLGRIDANGGYKGHRELVACWPEVIRAVPGARLLIAGAGAGLARIRAWARDSAAAGSIEFSGFVPEAELDALWGRATLFAMPSRGEGFGLVYVEAMRHGLPVVASVHDAASEIIVDAETGYHVNLDSPTALSERLVALLRDRDLAQRMGEAGRERWREFFCFSAFRQRFRPLLRTWTGLGND